MRPWLRPCGNGTKGKENDPTNTKGSALEETEPLAEEGKKRHGHKYDTTVNVDVKEENMKNEIQVRDTTDLQSLSVDQVMARINKIQEVMKRAMREGEHYGVIPGTDKPTLLKPGAEKLCLTFQLDPEFETEEVRQGDHLTIRSKCVLYHIPTGVRVGSGEGSCSTKESKYAYRKGSRKCPKCGQEAIIKGKQEYGGGWLCFKKKGGCGAKWDDGAAEIENQSADRVANEDLADQYNTVLKMANKRSLVAATLISTAASDIFNQDIEEMAEFQREAPKPEPKPETRKPSRKPTNGDPKYIDGAQRGMLLSIARGSGKNEQAVRDHLLKNFEISSLNAVPQEIYPEILEWAKGRQLAEEEEQGKGELP